MISPLEKQIVNLLQKSDKKAITLLYENYADALLGVIKKMISDDDTAQDVLQETFVKIWRYSKKYDSSKAKLFTWLYRIAYNSAIDKVRSQKNKSKKLTGQRPEVDKLTDPAIPFYKTFSNLDLRLLLPKLKTSIGRDMANVKRENLTRKNLILKQARHIYELHFKYASALICFIFLFIGAPMGAIIRKGGFGYPILISIIFFMLFIMLTIASKKMSESFAINPILAAWLPCIVLFPVGLFLTYKAMNDSKLLNVDRYVTWVQRLLQRGEVAE
mgnify:CR=1 FL=1